MKPKVLIIALLSLCLVAVAAVLSVNLSLRQLHAPMNVPEEGLLYEVPRGAALSRVTSDLYEQNILAHPRMLELFARFTGQATGIQAGEYRLMPGQTAIEALQMLVSGNVYLHQFTIIEGHRFAETLARLRAHPAIAASDLDSAGIMAALGKPELHPEGQFLPDTYSFPRGTVDTELLGWAHDAVQNLLEQRWPTRTNDGLLETPYDALILASIIEKETALDSERGLISGVIHERLRRGMRLQMDPTVIYGLGESFDGNLTRAQLETDSPYNTYTRRGLPPTPIALAGAASIIAAFSPVEEGYLYFVAAGDAEGSHVFSRTLEEHNAAVRRYVARQREANQ